MAKIFTKLNLADIVATSGGKSFRKLSTEEPKESVIGTWVFNSDWSPSSLAVGTYYINASLTTQYGTQEITYIQRSSGSGGGTYLYTSGSSIKNYSGTESITIHSGDDVTNETLILWLKANATKVS
jgi:hypothetical protein